MTFVGREWDRKNRGIADGFYHRRVGAFRAFPSNGLFVRVDRKWVDTTAFIIAYPQFPAQAVYLPGPWDFRIRSTESIVFQLRVVAGAPKSLSIWQR